MIMLTYKGEDNEYDFKITKTKQRRKSKNQYYNKLSRLKKLEKITININKAIKSIVRKKQGNYHFAKLLYGYF